MRKNAILPLILLTSISALAANYRGVLEDLSGHPLRGGKVLLAKAGDATSTAADGTWQFGAGSNGIGSKAIAPVRCVSGHLVVEQGRLRLDLGGVDASGKPLARSHVPARTAGTSIAARSDEASDTLLFAWNGRVRARMPASAAADVGVMKIDTSTNADDIPWNQKIRYGELIDDRDRQCYRTVTIGTQTWMAENLNYRTDSSWWAESSADNGALLGRNYRWTQALELNDSCDTVFCEVQGRVRGVCPSGWHVPATDEWKMLTDTSLENYRSAYVLKAMAGWRSSAIMVGNGIDSVGFRILKASEYMLMGPPAPETSTPSVLWFGLASFLSATQDEEISRTAESMRIRAGATEYGGLGKHAGASLRCLKD